MDVSDSIELLYEMYRSFNIRDIEGLLVLVNDNVKWADGTVGGVIIEAASARHRW